MKTDAAVVAVPRQMGNLKTMAIKDPTVQLDREGQNIKDRYFTTASITPIVKEGDRAIVDYTSIDYNRSISDADYDHREAWVATMNRPFICDGSYMIKISYADIYAVDRQGTLLAVGGWVLLKDLTPPHEEELRRPSGIILPKGFKRRKPKQVLSCQVEVIGENLNGLPPVAEKGQTVGVGRLGPWIEYNGEKYLVRQQNDILWVM